MAILLAAHEYPDYIALMHIGKRYCQFATHSFEEDALMETVILVPSMVDYDPTKTYYGVEWNRGNPSIFSDNDPSPIDIEDAVQNDCTTPLKAIQQERKSNIRQLEDGLKWLLSPPITNWDIVNYKNLEGHLGYLTELARQAKRLKEVELDLLRGCQSIVNE